MKGKAGASDIDRKSISAPRRPVMTVQPLIPNNVTGANGSSGIWDIKNRRIVVNTSVAEVSRRDSPNGW